MWNEFHRRRHYDASLRPPSAGQLCLGHFPRGRNAVGRAGRTDDTAIIVRQTGEVVFGVVSLITTLSLLIPSRISVSVLW